MAEARELEPANLRTVTTGLRFPEGPVAMDDGSVIVVEIAAGRLTRCHPDGSTSVVAETGGGPNGAALSTDGASLWVANNGGCFDWHEVMGLTFPGSPPPASWPGHGSLQRVDLASGSVEEVHSSCEGEALRAPNDLVLDADGGIWFTDHGVRLPRASDRTGVYWSAPDGSSVREVAFPLDAPNGIGLSPDGSTLYVAETHTGRVWSWPVVGPGSLGGEDPFGPAGGTLLGDPGGGSLFDSLAVDAAGWVCVATLGPRCGITCFSPDGSEVEHLALPDPLTTNICFGSVDGVTTAYVTLSGTGQLVAFDWHR